MTPAPNNQDDELIDILWELIRHAKNPHDRENKFHSMPEAKAAILAWHNQQLEQAVIEARVDELNRVTGEFTTEDDHGNKVSTFQRLTYLLSKSKEGK